MSNSELRQQATINHRETAKRGKFDLGEGAEMTYTRPTPDVMKINHTRVDPILLDERT
jgi:predicted GNAT family acetyltransferase